MQPPTRALESRMGSAKGSRRLGGGWLATCVDEQRWLGGSEWHDRDEQLDLHDVVAMSFPCTFRAIFSPTHPPTHLQPPNPSALQTPAHARWPPGGRLCPMPLQNTQSHTPSPFSAPNEAPPFPPSASLSQVRLCLDIPPLAPNQTPFPRPLAPLRTCRCTPMPTCACHRIKPPLSTLFRPLIRPPPPLPPPAHSPPLQVYTDGHLCLDLLQDAWSPCHSVSSLLTSIQSLLTDPNCSSPANPEAAHQYMSDRVGYNRKVRRLAEKTLDV